MRKIVIVLAILLGSISLMAQGSILAGSLHEEEFVEGIGYVGGKARCYYNSDTRTVEIHVQFLTHNPNVSSVSLSGYVSNIASISEQNVTGGRVYYYPVHDSKSGTRVQGYVNFNFGNHSMSMYVNVTIP